MKDEKLKKKRPASSKEDKEEKQIELQEQLVLLKDRLKIIEGELDSCMSSIHLIEKTLDEKLTNIDFKKIMTESQMNNLADDIYERVYAPVIDDVTEKLNDIIGDIVDSSDLADDARRALDTANECDERIDDVEKDVEDHSDRICKLEEDIEKLMNNHNG